MKLIIEGGPGLGDVVMLTPVLKKLKEKQPDIGIIVLANENNLFLIDKLPYVDGTIGIKRGNFLGHYLPGLSFRGADIIVFTTWQPQLVLMANLFKVPQIIGACRKEKYHKYFTQIIKDTEEFTDRFKADTLTELIGNALSIDLANDGICEVSGPAENDLLSVRELMKKAGLDSNNSFAVIAPFCKTAQALPMKLIGGIIKYITEQEIPCVVIDSDVHEEINSFVRQYKKVVNLTGKTSAGEMLAILQTAAFAVGTDSGPMHISCALKTPMVVVFSSDNPQKWAPKKYCYPLSVGEPCVPCTKERSQQCAHKSCINKITTTMVIQKINEMFFHEIPELRQYK